MTPQPSKLNLNPLEREGQSFRRSVQAAEAAAKINPSVAIDHLCNALRTQSVILAVIIKTLGEVVKENKEVTDSHANLLERFNALIRQGAENDQMLAETVREFVQVGPIREAPVEGEKYPQEKYQ